MGSNETALLREGVVWLLVAALSPLAAGCDTMRDSTMTRRLWDAADNRCLPAAKLNLKFYRTADVDYVLVTWCTSPPGVLIRKPPASVLENLRAKTF